MEVREAQKENTSVRGITRNGVKKVYMKNRKLKINKIFVCLGHTNLSFSSLDLLAPLFPECIFFLIAASHFKNDENPTGTGGQDPVWYPSMPLLPHYYKKKCFF